ncbi:MAG: AAA family ATPase [Chlamydiia bacterium]|nr:AAA family ATPase [Chlamydiia bacterium]
MPRKAFFIAATEQNVGKTTTCLGLVAGYKNRQHTVGYLKPVGQEYVEIETGISVDKDVLLFKEYFHLQDSYEEMSPILFPRGFTRDYLDGKVDSKGLSDKILHAFHAISQRNDLTIVEGTGHTGVGSIVNLNNAQVAVLLKTPLILIAPGGLGSSFDDLALNYTQCEKQGARVAGVILNCVLEEKAEMIRKYMEKALKRWNIPLLGCIPYDAFLSTPTLYDFEQLFQTTLLTGSLFRLRHFESIQLIASPLEIKRAHALPNQLIIAPANREDIILSALTQYWDAKIANPQSNLGTGLILTGRTPPTERLLEQIGKADIPALYVPLSSFAVMKMINNYTIKTKKDDLPKIEEAIKIVEKHVDLDHLLQRVSAKGR